MAWDDLRFVLEAARSKSLSQASKRLLVNQSTVLRRVVSFQETYDVQLFDVRQKGYRLNNLGHEVLHDLMQIEGDIINIERKLLGKGEHLTGTLRLSTPDILFDAFLAPILAEFRALYPGIRIVALQSYKPLNLARRETDIAIRMTNNPDRISSANGWAKCRSASIGGANALPPKPQRTTIGLDWPTMSATSGRHVGCARSTPTQTSRSRSTPCPAWFPPPEQDLERCSCLVSSATTMPSCRVLAVRSAI